MRTDAQSACAGEKNVGSESMEIRRQLKEYFSQKSDVDTVLLFGSVAEGVFLYQIMTTGIKIKIEPHVFVWYLTKALCFKENFMPVIERFQKEKIRRFING